MKSRSELLSALSAIVLFLLLETVSAILAARGGVVQRYRVLGAVRSVESWFWEKSRQAGYYFNYKTENERLAAENLELRRKLSSYEAAAARMEIPAPADADPAFSYIGATVIKNSVDKQHNYLILDRGRDDGVEVGLGVVTARGVIGIVSGVSRHYCYVVSLLSADQSVSVKLAGDGSFGPMTWPGVSPEETVLREIPVHTAVAPGDTVVTSGYSTIYPAGIPVGSVRQTSIDRGMSQDIDIRLFESFRSLYHVYVVKNNHAEELEGLQ